VGPKAAAFAFLLRMFLVPLAPVRDQWLPLIVGVAVATMTLGNLAAISQSNIKRLLGYSAISHAGYMLLGLVSGNETGLKGIAIYLLVYAFMNLGAFAVIVAMRRKGGMSHADFPAVARRHSSDRGLSGQVLHLLFTD
jgi:NADH-quinone oxidoreductase subunit N